MSIAVRLKQLHASAAERSVLGQHINRRTSQQIEEVMAHWRDRRGNRFASAVMEPRNALGNELALRLQTISAVANKLSKHAENCEDHIRLINTQLSDLEPMWEGCRRLTESARYSAASARNEAGSIINNASALSSRVIALGNPPSA